MKIEIEVKDLKELAKWCEQQLSTLLDTKKKVFIDNTGKIRRKKMWEQFELDSLVQWYRKGKKCRWIAIQLSRDVRSIQMMIHHLRKKGLDLPKRIHKAITINNN